MCRPISHENRHWYTALQYANSTQIKPYIFTFYRPCMKPEQIFSFFRKTT